MRIGMIAPPWFPLPPQRYGGIEFVVSLLTEGLVARGHDVTLFASGDSETQARLSYIFARAPFEHIEKGAHLEVMHSLEAYTRAREFDVIHDHDGLASRAMGALVHQLAGTPVVATLHGPADAITQELLGSLRDDLRFIAISDYQRQGFPDLRFVGTIPNAVDVEHMPFSADKDDYLLFIGRMTADKGAHTAIEVARRLDPRLIMAGKVNEGPEREYFAAEVEPHLSDKHPLPRRGRPRDQGRALQARPLHAVPDPVARALRPGDDRVARLRHAGDRLSPGLGARGDRARPHAGSSSRPSTRWSRRARASTRSTRPSAAAPWRSASASEAFVGAHEAAYERCSGRRRRRLTPAGRRDPDVS